MKKFEENVMRNDFFLRVELNIFTYFQSFIEFLGRINRGENGV